MPDRATFPPPRPNFDVPEGLRRSARHLEAMWPLSEGLSNKSPRGNVLICAGPLEQQLRDILVAFMVHCPNARVPLDAANAPLGALGARTAACHALALITDDEHGDLTLIRRIRNQLARKIETNFDPTPAPVHATSLPAIGTGAPSSAQCPRHRKSPALSSDSSTRYDGGNRSWRRLAEVGRSSETSATKRSTPSPPLCGGVNITSFWDRGLPLTP